MPKEDTQFKPGHSGNPHGRPKSPEIESLRHALAKVEAEQGKTFIEEFVRKAFTDKDYAIALARKILPDLKALEVSSIEGLTITIVAESGKDNKS